MPVILVSGGFRVCSRNRKIQCKFSREFAAEIRGRDVQLDQPCSVKESASKDQSPLRVRSHSKSAPKSAFKCKRPMLICMHLLGFMEDSSPFEAYARVGFLESVTPSAALYPLNFLEVVLCPDSFNHDGDTF